MRLVTWNCFRGDLHTRAADIGDLRPDLLVLQECAQPTSSGPEPSAWFGTNPRHGFGVVAREGIHLEALPQHESLDHSVFPLHVSGEYSFNLLGIWAKPAPTYVDSILRGLDVYARVLRDAPTIVVGDFNSNARFDKYGGPSHGELVMRLEAEFGLVSAFHTTAPTSPEEVEPPTHFWRWNQANGFHIDYCFIPREWSARIQSCFIVDEPAGSRRSDHRPLVVDLDIPAESLPLMDLQSLQGSPAGR